MGKMLGAMTTIVLLQFAIFFAVGACLTEDGAGNCINTAETQDFIPGTALFNLIKNTISLDGGTCSLEGVNWSSTGVPNEPDCGTAGGTWVPGDSFWTWLLGLVAVVGAGGLVVAGLYITKPDFAFYLTIAGALAITEGPVYWNAFAAVKNSLCSTDINGITSCLIPVEILALFMCIFIIPWIIIILDYARGRD